MPVAKKKPVVKKSASLKKPVAKATPAKKIPVRRGRKPKIDPVVQEAVAQVNTCEDKQVEQETAISRLRTVHILDMRQTTKIGRLHVLNYLSEEGYIAPDLTSLMDDLDSGANLELIKFNHNNKIVLQATLEDLKNSHAVARIYVNTDTKFGIPDAEPYHPDTIEQGSATYIRIK